MKDELFHLIERIGALTQSGRRPGAAQHGLQSVHVDILSYLSRCNRYSDTPSALTVYLGVTKGTVSQSIALLQRNGFLMKTPDPQDRRVVHMALTSKGKNALKDCTPLVGSTLGQLPTAEVDVAVGVLKTVLRTAQAAHDFRTFGECRTCRHLVTKARGGYRCGLTEEALSVQDTTKICAEHQLTPLEEG